jgi:predicted nuclease of restriction endonuclease-like RecB superfamily
MLTLDLLRFRTRDDTVTPIYLSPAGRYWNIANRVIATYHACLGRTLGELERELDELAGSAADYKVYRGFAKLMTDAIDLTPPAEVDAEALRKQVFTLAAGMGPLARRPDMIFSTTVAEKVPEIAAQAGVPAEQLVSALYADLRECQVICALDAGIGPKELIERYNTALAQAMLYRAVQMVIEVYDNYRQLFKYLKLARLMHVITPIEGGYRIRLDGPASLFANVERYGVAMAVLLPAVLKCRRWRMVAKVRVGGEEKLFHLSPREGLQSHYRDEPQFNSAAEEAFFQRFSRKSKNKWTIEREGAILSLHNTVMIPDFTFRHQDGRVVHLEIVGFWTPQYLAKKIEKIKTLDPPNIVLAIPQSLNCANEEFNGPVIRFKERLLIKDVLPMIEEYAKVEIIAELVVNKDGNEG